MVRYGNKDKTCLPCYMWVHTHVQFVLLSMFHILTQTSLKGFWGHILAFLGVFWHTQIGAPWAILFAHTPFWGFGDPF